MDDTERQALADERERLKIKLLKAKIADLEHGGKLGARVARNGALITALFTAVAGVFALCQFISLQKKTRQDRVEELHKAYWQEQKNVYDRAVRSASVIAAVDSLAEVPDEQREFSVLWLGETRLVESHEVELAMEAFGQKFREWQHTRMKPSGMGYLAQQLAYCAAQSLARTWHPASGMSLRVKGCPYD